jgi:beta-glucosidase
MNYTGGYKGQLAPTVPEVSNDAMDNELASLRTGNLKKPYRSWKRLVMTCTGVLVSISLILLTAALIAGLVIWIRWQHRYPDTGDALHWNWNSINLNDIHFPKDFLWGISSSAHAVEGNCTNNQWYRWERTIIDPDTGKTPIHNGDKSGMAADHWNRYVEDIQIMKNQFHLKAYRFSIEWSKIEPTKGNFDASAIQHYHSVIDTLLKNSIEPIVTLHHYTDPIWFADMGGFEKIENIEHFVNFSKFVFGEYSSKVKRFITLNAPNIYSLVGYSQGEFPPGKHDVKLGATVMRNLAETHVRVYEAIKSMPGGNSSQVGIIINFQQFDPANNTNTLDRMISTLLNNAYTGAYMGFFSKGTFIFSNPPKVNIRYTNMKALTSLDFIGINYYANMYAKFNFKAENHYELVKRDKDIQTDIGWPLYAEGIYRAIKTASELKVPMLITENGIADAKDNLRDLFIRRYLYAVSKAIKEGYNVIGYLYWTLLDSFHWQFGFEMKFGLCHVDLNTQKRSVRIASRAYSQIVKRFS